MSVCVCVGGGGGGGMGELILVTMGVDPSFY